MKKFLTFTMTALMAIPTLAATTTTTTSSYEDSYSPVLEEEVIEEEEYAPINFDDQQRMEESSFSVESEDAIDYSDRTRTNRERKAINTGSDASDDQ